MVLWVPSLLKILQRVRRLHAEIPIGCVHYNHESLFYIAWWLKKALKLKAVFHIRTRPMPGPWARLQWRLIRAVGDYLIFITENELEHARQITGSCRFPDHSVIFNIGESIFRNGGKPKNRQLRIMLLGTVMPSKGVDRVVQIADSLRGRQIPFRIDIFGSAPDPPKSFFPVRDNYLQSIRSSIESLGLSDCVHFCGYVNDPLMVLAKADILLRLTRDNDPWGRDVIEAMAMGVPVISTGEYEGFIKNGENGFVIPDYSTEAFVDKIQLLANDPSLRKEISQRCRENAKYLFNGQARAKEVEAIYTKLLNAGFMSKPDGAH